VCVRANDAGDRVKWRSRTKVADLTKLGKRLGKFVFRTIGVMKEMAEYSLRDCIGKIGTSTYYNNRFYVDNRELRWSNDEIVCTD